MADKDYRQKISLSLTQGANMGQRYGHLTYEERIQIRTYLQELYSIRLIAQKMNRSHSTIAREIKRNSGKRGYRFKQAQAFANARQHQSRYQKMTPEISAYVDDKIRQKHSPQQISDNMLSSLGCRISHERIYQYIYRDKAAGGTLYKELRINFKRRYRRQRDRKNWRLKIPNRVDIDQRPQHVNNRSRYGDWEADLVCGKTYLVTLVERKSRFTLIGHVDKKNAEAVSAEIVKLLAPYRNLVHTITYDNGNEFARHEAVNEQLGCLSYFAKPYHSWERGTNENTNGLIRQYFPKNEKLLDASREKISFVQNQLNDRPRKVLANFRPMEIFMGQL